MKRINGQNVFEHTGLKPENQNVKSEKLLRQITEKTCGHVSVSEVIGALSITAKTKQVKFQVNGHERPLKLNKRIRLKPGSRLIIDSESFFVVSTEV